MERCAVGLIGWGTVGGGVVQILRQDAAVFRERCGLDLELTRIVTRTPGKKRAAAPAGATVSNRLGDVLDDPAIRIVVHLVGGTTEATDICRACLRAGKHVVTANKAMLAEHGDELFALAAANDVCIAFEAAVAGGIPIIAALRDGLVANRIQAIHGILNGTCNYILTNMESAGMSYADALAAAQRLGYAEADPTLDVNGTDTAHKLAILARLAFGGRIPLADVRVEGIQSITYQDIVSAKRMGARIKLLAVAQRQAAGLELRVAPTLVPLDHPLAAVGANHNGIAITSNNAGSTLLVGPGAGDLPTASAVLSDVVSLCTGGYQAMAKRFVFGRADQVPPKLLPESEEVTGSYARFLVPNKTGVLAGITAILSTHGISVRSINQGEPDSDGRATIEAITYPLRGGSFLAAVAAIDASRLTVRPTVILRRL